jgi:hypothetical protein
MDTRIARSLRILTAWLFVSAGATATAMADDVLIINQRLAAMSLHICVANPAAGGAYHLQVGRTAPGTPPTGGTRPGQCPFSIDARFEGGVLVLDKEGLGRAGLVFPLLPPGVKIASFPSGLQLLHPTGAMPPTDLNTMQHSLDHANEMKTEALARMGALKNAAAQANAILDSCPLPDMGQWNSPLPVPWDSPSLEAMEDVLDHASCAGYVHNVATDEQNCGTHLENLKARLDTVEGIQKCAAGRCAGEGLSTGDKQTLKDELVNLQNDAANDANRIEALIVRIQQLIQQYLACISSKQSPVSGG